MSSVTNYDLQEAATSRVGLSYRVIFFKGQNVNSYYYTIKHVYY